MIRYTLGELPDAFASGWFTTGDTVTISVYNLLGGASVALTSNACIEVGTTGQFRWSWDNIVTKPTAFVEYLYIMDNGVTQTRDQIIFGGYPDLVAPTGPSLVTINTQEADTTPIPDVFVKIYNMFSQLIGYGYTDAGGQLVRNMYDGNYTIVLYKTGANFAASESLVVSGATTDTYNGTVTTIEAPASANICRVYGYSKVQNDTAATPTFDGTATISSLPFKISTSFFEGQSVKAQFNTSSGLFYWDLPYGAVVKLNSRVIGITNGLISVPEQSTVSLSSLDIR